MEWARKTDRGINPRPENVAVAARNWLWEEYRAREQKEKRRFNIMSQMADWARSQYSKRLRVV